MQVYSDPSKENDPHALPDTEVFHVEQSENRLTPEGEVMDEGYYWWACQPGCLPDSDPDGPHESEYAAIKAMRETLDIEVTYRKFLCCGVGAYGNGETYEQAMANYKEASGNTRCLVYMWIGELPHSAWGHAMGMSWRGTQERPILIQDNRLAKYRRNHPLEIGGEG